MELEQEIEEVNSDIEEKEVSLFDPKEIDIATEQNSLSTITSMIEDNVIDMNTEFQRSGNLWNDKTMSLLIEST